MQVRLPFFMALYGSLHALHVSGIRRGSIREIRLIRFIWLTNELMPA